MPRDTKMSLIFFKNVDLQVIQLQWNAMLVAIIDIFFKENLTPVNGNRVAIKFRI